MTDLVILNEDALRASHPVFYRANETPDTAFIWDPEYFQATHCGLKRQIFIYETLCTLDVEIYCGAFMDVFQALVSDLQPEHIFVPYSVNPLLQQRHEIMAAAMAVESFTIVKDDPFVIIDDLADLRRFFRYWNKAKKAAFSYNGLSD